METRRATFQDLGEILQLFAGTIQTVNAADYTEDQLNAWSSGASNQEGWKNRITEQYFLVAEINGVIAGFASISFEGYIDLIFVHKDYQRLGVAKRLMHEMEIFATKKALPEIWSDVSITAVPFFLKSGFETDHQYEKTFNGVTFRNTIMRKKSVLPL
ncbi:GNAT family N-acetyltransferase [Emticicia sp. CRIBPO]|uniref:GNAT family N-acetyltransferase n=1 Tax=Emticicia sp. CRIBPO TaxID=2683258 RepID=UPI001412BD34|nr:GNAT family N-acetyltransferase [Emticicia sp. CRIBPO]NBA87446.1 GNAT family N-acetyltransferase [Emticicia sp. CRIBPO]